MRITEAAMAEFCRITGIDPGNQARINDLILGFFARSRHKSTDAQTGTELWIGKIEGQRLEIYRRGELVVRVRSKFPGIRIREGRRARRKGGGK